MGLRDNPLQNLQAITVRFIKSCFLTDLGFQKRKRAVVSIFHNNRKAAAFFEKKQLYESFLFRFNLPIGMDCVIKEIVKHTAQFLG